MRMKIATHHVAGEARALGVALKESVAGRDLLTLDVMEQWVGSPLLNVPGAWVI